MAVAWSAGSTLAAPPPIAKAGREWWAFQPVRATAPPAPDVAGWCRNEIDHFILQRLAGARLQPSPEAGRHVLIRRVYFDMLGLPPNPEEVRAFINDKSETPASLARLA